TAERRVVASTGIAVADTRDPDDDAALWPSDVSEDGRTCLFAGRAGTSIVVAMSAANRTITTVADSCVLSGDGSTAWCARGDMLLSIDIARDRVVSSRAAGGKVGGLVRFRGAPVAVVRRATACTVEAFDGQLVATLPGGEDCTHPRAIADTAIAVARGHHTAV